MTRWQRLADKSESGGAGKEQEWRERGKERKKRKSFLREALSGAAARKGGRRGEVREKKGKVLVKIDFEGRRKVRFESKKQIKGM